MTEHLRPYAVSVKIGAFHFFVGECDTFEKAELLADNEFVRRLRTWERKKGRKGARPVTYVWQQKIGIS